MDNRITDPGWIAQSIGFLALLVNCAAFLTKRRPSIVGWQILSSGIWVIHFGMLGASTAAAMNLLGAARQGIFLFRGRYPWASARWWPLGFCLIFVGGGALTWQTPSSLLPVLAMVLGTIASWQAETRRLRILSIFPLPLWFSYNAIHGSLAGMLTEILIFLSQIVGWLRCERSIPGRGDREVRTSPI